MSSKLQVWSFWAITFIVDLVPLKLNRPYSPLSFSRYFYLYVLFNMIWPYTTPIPIVRFQCPRLCITLAANPLLSLTNPSTTPSSISIYSYTSWYIYFNLNKQHKNIIGAMVGIGVYQRPAPKINAKLETERKLWVWFRYLNPTLYPTTHNCFPKISLKPAIVFRKTMIKVLRNSCFHDLRETRNNHLIFNEVDLKF